ncbi:hypothetical protein Hanom_Chr02g00126821 [Helianthus anomalus]
MDGINETDENGKIPNLFDMWKNKSLDKSRKTGQTLGTMAFYSNIKYLFFVWVDTKHSLSKYLVSISSRT